MYSLFGLRMLELAAAVVGLNLLLVTPAVGFSSCYRDVLGKSVSYTCPRPEDDSFEESLCCPSYSDKQCCSIEDIEELGWEDWKDILEQADEGLNSYYQMLGSICAVVVLLSLVGLACCCCVPCCKRRRTRGQTHGPAAAGLEAQPMTAAAGAGYPIQPQQQGYPLAQQTGYPSAQPGYPPAQQPTFQDDPPPYPGPPLSGQAAPPVQPYPTKQPAFNPNVV